MRPEPGDADSALSLRVQITRDRRPDDEILEHRAKARPFRRTGHDADLGIGRGRRYTAFQEVGRAIHPSYVEGQIQGGAAQGIGWALSEEYIFNKDGKLDNPSFLDYRMPVSSDLPMLDSVILEIPNPKHPQGVRGVGEVPLVPPLAAVSNAIYDALGRRFYSLPMSPPKVLAAMDMAAE